MLPKTARSVVLLFVSTLVLAPAPAGSETGLGDLLAVREEANQASAASQQRVDALSDETDALVAEYSRVLQQIDSLRVYNRQLDELVGSQEREKASLHSQIENVTVVGRQVTPLMLEMIDALGAFVALDMPFLPDERRERVAGLREMMDRSDVANSEKYRRILEAYQIENEYGRTLEAYRGELDRDGQPLTVDFLRVGRIALLYQTLDGREVGAWDAEEGRWVQLPASYRSAVREGLRIARKQAAPDLILIPAPAPVPAPASEPAG
jgi:hypothetical protein